MKFAIAGISFILLVAAVVADQTTDSNMAVQTIRSGPEAIFDEPCEKTLANTSDPKELVKQSFDASVKNISNVLKITTLWTNTTKNQRNKGAFAVCLDVLGFALDDLNTSIALVDAFDASTTKEAVMDVRVKVSAVGTNYGTCGDAINDAINEPNSDKRGCDEMMNLLNSSKESAYLASQRFYCAYRKWWAEEEKARDETISVAEYEEQKRKKKQLLKLKKQNQKQKQKQNMKKRRGGRRSY